MCLFISSTSFAREVKLEFKHLDTENGLSSRSVSSCIQDANGFIWFGTKNGLNKFDGSKFKIYTHQKNDSLSIADDNIRKIFRLKNDEIWVSTGRGLSKYDALHDRFIYLGSRAEQNGGLSNSFVSAITEMPNNKTYVLAFDGINLMDKQNLSFKHYPAMIGNEQIFHFTDAVQYNREEILLSSYNNGLILFDTETKTYSKFDNKYPELENIPQSVTTILFINNDIWIGTPDGLYSFNLKSRLLTNYTSNPKSHLSVRTWVNTIYLDNDSNVWIGTMADGLLSYNYDCDSFTIYREDANNPNSISRNAISSIYQDRQGILWVGTYEGGVNYAHPMFNNFSTVSHQVGNNNSLISNQVTCFLEDSEGDLWVGTENGLSIQTNENEFINLTTGNSWLRHDKIQSLSELNPGEILIGHRTGIDIIQKTATTIKSLHFNDLPHLSNQWVSKISGLSENKIIVLFASGLLVLYDISESQTTVIHDNQHDVNANDFVLNLKKGLWFLTKNEIVYYDLGTKTKKQIWKNTSEDNLSFLAVNNEQTDICVTGSNKLQVFNYNIKSQQTKEFKSNDCQLCEIRSMEFDSKGQLWLGTTNGLLSLNPEKERWSYYTNQDGLSSNMSNKSIFQSKNGTIYLSTNKGYTFFHPQDIIKNTTPPQVRISEVFLFNKRIKPGEYQGMPKDVNRHKKLSFNYNHSFTFYFSVLNYLYPHKNKVLVFLEGHDKDWVELGPDHKITYTKLEPNDYKLHYKASNNDGIWSETREISLYIKPPFWEQVWFRLLLTALFVLIIALIIRTKLHRIKREKRLLEDKVKRRTEDLALTNQQLKSANSTLNQMVALKNKFFSIVAHDLKSPFHAISSFSELLIENFEYIDRTRALSYITEIKSSSTEAADFLENLYTWARIQNNSYGFSPTSVSLSGVVARVYDLLQLNARNKNIELNNSVPDDLFAFADETMLFLCIQNLVSNGIKFTSNNGKITITAEEKPETILLKVSDNGMGMEAGTLDSLFKLDKHTSTPGTNGEKGSGLGLILVREFVDKNKGTIEVQSKPGQGTTFLLEFEKTEKLKSSGISDTDVVPEKPDTDLTKVTDFLPEIKENEYKVLIVEDMRSIRLHLIAVLEKYFVVFEASDGKAGYEMIIKEKPDLIISDVAMPFMDGIELCKLVKTSPAISHIPIILLTAKDTIDDRLTGLGVGADDYIVKPFEVAILIARVNNLIQSRNKMRQKFASQIELEADQLANTDIDKLFFKKAVDLIHEHIDKNEFTIDTFVKLMGGSRSSVYDKIKAVTNMSVNEFIKTIRLKKAALLIRESNLSISEVAYRVGFKDTSHFTKVFKKQYGKSPTEYKTTCG